MNDYEIGLEDRQTKKRWAGENYGWQSPASFNKLYVAGKLNPVQQQIDRVTSTVKTAIEQTPYIGGLLQFAGGVAKTAYQTLPQPVQQGIQFGLEKSQEAATTCRKWMVNNWWNISAVVVTKRIFPC